MLNWLRRRSEISQLVVPLPDAQDRIYAVGDIHGRHDLLAGLLPKLREDARAQSDERRPVLLLLGDYIDRGDHSREVLDLILAESALHGPWDKLIALRGNHEAALLDFLDTPEQGSNWLSFGGKQTLASYGLPVPKARPSKEELTELANGLSRAMGPHVDFLNRTAHAFRSGAVVFAHAGIDPTKNLNEQPEEATLWGRSPFLEQGAPASLRVVHGHWDDPEPVVSAQRICLDTGAYYSGKLTAARLDAGTELITVDVFDL